MPKSNNQSSSGKSVTQASSIFEWMGVKTRSALTLIALLVLIVTSGLAVVLKEHQNRRVFHELQELKDQSNELEVKWGQLLIEQSTFGVEGRVEQKAVDDLKMQLPELSEIIMAVSYTHLTLPTNREV